jgi:hypothetical protein
MQVLRPRLNMWHVIDSSALQLAPGSGPGLRCQGSVKRRRSSGSGGSSAAGLGGTDTTESLSAEDAPHGLVHMARVYAGLGAVSRGRRCAGLATFGGGLHTGRAPRNRLAAAIQDPLGRAKRATRQ